MKTLKKLGIFLILITFLVKLTGCNDYLDSSVFASQLTSKTWRIQSVTVDNVDKTSSLLKGMTIDFDGSVSSSDGNKSGLTYTTSNGSPILPPSGKWDFEAEEDKNFIADRVKIEFEDIEMYAELKEKENKLTLKFNWNSTNYGGRQASIKGDYVLVFTK